MAENPATWRTAEHIISKELDQYYEDMHSREFFAGLTLTHRIAEALREVELLRENCFNCERLEGAPSAPCKDCRDYQP